MAFASPPTPLPVRRQHSSLCRPPSTHRWKASLIAVAGATGGIGSLLVNRLLSSPFPNDTRNSITVSSVRVLTRNISKAQSILPVENQNLSLSNIPSIALATPQQLDTVLKGAQVLVICVGSTAFPTRKWQNGNTPSAVDDKGILNLVNAVDPHTIKRIAMVSSIGTSRTSKFPFNILNVFGAMAAKRSGEVHVKEAAQQLGISYSIVRCGRLLGAPHTNEGMIREEPDPNKLDIKLAPGDSLLGDLSRSAAADVMYFASTWDTSVDFDIAAVHTHGSPPQMHSWEKKLLDVQTKRKLPSILP